MGSVDCESVFVETLLELAYLSAYRSVLRVFSLQDLLGEIFAIIHV